MTKKKAPGGPTSIVNKEGAKSSAPPAVAPEAVLAALPINPYAPMPINEKYHAKLMECLNIIVETYPNIVLFDPLPEVGDTGFHKLLGVGAPYNGDHYNARFLAGQEYSTHINFLWQNIVNCVLPYVPLYWERTVEYADCHLRTPCVPTTSSLVILADFGDGNQIQKGQLTAVSPCETRHAFVYRVSERIKSGASNTELDKWLGLLLSYPVIFKKITSDDEKYSEANSLREDVSGAARAVTLSARQLIHNIAGFKAAKEKALKAKFGADHIAKVWKDTIRVSKSNEILTKKSTIDTCLTIKDRVLSLPGIEDIWIKSDTRDGPTSFFNFLFKVQEIVYRGGTKKNIKWIIECIDDQLTSGKTPDAEITVSSLKTGSKSVTDPMLVQLDLRDYLLGPWLDSKLEIPEYMKKKCREVFQNHKTFRHLWHPLDHDGSVDTTWLFAWPRFGRDLMSFMEGSLYLPTQTEEHLYRLAVKNNSTMEEILSQRPWVDTIASIMSAIRATAQPETHAGAVAGQGTSAGEGPEQGGSGAAPLAGGVNENRDASLDQQLNDSVFRLMRQQTSYLLEVSSFAGMKQLVEKEPLAMVQSSTESGHVMTLFDANTWGYTDHRPNERIVPIGKDKFDIPLRGVIAARHGLEQPEKLNHGEFYVCVNGGRDRKRFFLNAVKNPNMKHRGMDKDRTVTRIVTAHMTEQSWRARKRKPRGQAKLTQQIYMSGNASTFTNLRHASFVKIAGSTRSDVCGPITLDAPEDLPTLPAAAMKDFFGKRFVLAGGRVAEGSDDDDDDGDDDDNVDTQEAPASDPPIAPHCLPLVLMTEYCKAYNVKHVIDLSPTPLDLGFEIVRNGGSYVAVCASTQQIEYLRNILFQKLKLAILDDSEVLLYDPRFLAVKNAPLVTGQSFQWQLIGSIAIKYT